MPRIFISYRRDDSAFVAGLLGDKLVSRFGRDAVFMDVDNIPFGVDFRSHLLDAVGKCNVLLALIGESWLTQTDAHGRRRLDDPADFVRIEIEAALRRSIPVIPILVGDSRMPVESQLPPSLAPLAYRNAAIIKPGRDLTPHLEALLNGISQLNPIIGRPPSTPIPPGPHPTYPQPPPHHFVQPAGKSGIMRKVAMILLFVAGSWILLAMLAFLSWVAR